MEATPSMGVHTKAVRAASTLSLCPSTTTRTARIHPSTLSRHSQEGISLYDVLTGPDNDMYHDMTHSARSACCLTYTIRTWDSNTILS